MLRKVRCYEKYCSAFCEPRSYPHFNAFPNVGRHGGEPHPKDLLPSLLCREELLEECLALAIQTIPFGGRSRKPRGPVAQRLLVPDLKPAIAKTAKIENGDSIPGLF